MKTLQEYLSQNYPKNTRNQITEINIRNISLTGHLDLSDFINLKKVDCSNSTVLFSSKYNINSIDVSKCLQLIELNCSNNSIDDNLDVSNNLQLVKLDCSRNNLSNLDLTKNENLSKLICFGNKLKNLDISNNKKLSTLDCSENDLESLDVDKCTKLTKIYCSLNKLVHLDLSNCPDLNELGCNNNKLTCLNLNKCNKLSTLYCSDNRLTNLDISCCPKLITLNCNRNLLNKLEFSRTSNALITLSVYGNNFCEDLSHFSLLINLRSLNINNNSFFGSLKYLCNLTKLEFLDIDDTDIDCGLEYLSIISNLKYLYCAKQDRSESKVFEIEKTLKPYKKEKKSRNLYLPYQEWKKDNLVQIEVTKQFVKLDREVQQLRTQLQSVEGTQLTKIANIITSNFLFDLKSLKLEIKRLKANDLANQIQKQKVELDQLTIVKFNEDTQEMWEIFCEAQEEITKNNDNSFAHKQLARAKKSLSKKVNETELRIIFDKQAKNEEFKKQLKNLYKETY